MGCRIKWVLLFSGIAACFAARATADELQNRNAAMYGITKVIERGER
jgi:hypothetical protein